MPVLALGNVPAYQAGRQGAERWCIRHGDDVLNWGELDAFSTRRAHALYLEGVRKDDLVVIALPNGNALHELAFAVWKLGATPAVIPGHLPDAELSAVIELAQPRVVIAQGETAQGCSRALPAEFGRDHGNAAPIEAAVARYWKVMTSGGSTGRPKLIVARQPAQLDTSAGSLRLPEDSVILNAGPSYHNMPFAMSHMALLRGNSLVGMVKFDPLEALRLIARFRVAWVNFVPTMMRRIWALPPEERNAYDLSCLQTVWHTAAPMPDWLKLAWIKWLGPDRIFECYGGTEGIGITALNGTEWLAHPGSVGRPLGCNVRVLDANGQENPPGEVGEIYFFPSDPAQGDSFHYVGAEARRGPGGSISLGDHGHVDSEGFLFIEGRRTDLILSGGANIYPAEIENILSTCAGVAAVVVIGLPDEDLGERVHAIVELLDPAHPPSERDLRAAVESHLARSKCPRSYEFVTSPLRDSAGKVRRSQLRDQRIAAPG